MQPDLTAGWSTIPGAHEGSETGFEIHLQFSEDVDLVEVIGERNLLEHAFTVTGGSIEAIRPARDRRGEYLANEWAMRVAARFGGAGDDFAGGGTCMRPARGHLHDR